MRIDDVINELNKIKRMEGNVEVKYIILRQYDKEVDFEMAINLMNDELLSKGDLNI